LGVVSSNQQYFIYYHKEDFFSCEVQLFKNSGTTKKIIQ
jgi:hypothetical protein